MTTTRAATYRHLEEFLSGATLMTVKRLRDLEILEGCAPLVPTLWTSAKEMADALEYLGFHEAADDIEAKLELYEWLLDYRPSEA